MSVGGREFLPGGAALALVVARGGVLPLGAQESIAEAGGQVLVIGGGAKAAAQSVTGASALWWSDTGPGLRVGAVARVLAGVLADVPLLLLPASPDGRDLAPRLAAELDRPLLAGAVSVRRDGAVVRAELSRVDGRLLLTVECAQPAVATLLPGVRTVSAVGHQPDPCEVTLPALPPQVWDVDVVEVVEPDPATMDLSEAGRVVGGGAGLVPAGSGGDQARALFDLLAGVSAALGASAGATRVATDAGWIGYDRQIGTTGVTVDPELYVAFGISGASQHVGGLGSPRHVVSVNVDPSCPMTAMADLGLVTDARDLLVELARRFGVTVAEEVRS
ncbi:mycofactocin-associated electron transfer flavoprotein alpha subunit [Candidatus Protofrankia californiensis]|uniref:mycofactocin-associated electron transfer flavoprotein alpha subunit n=1 Tax=Candidatus Protofrankia californiensis TaxID=1839754 RepID=UPI0010412309|nr:mycofactocin-associated electron transfer flavoprotein alpha subunit [Candidatus Protofrankia californiensis]